MLRVDLNIFGNRTEKNDLRIPDRCKREYRPYRTWVEAGKWGVGALRYGWAVWGSGPRGAAPLGWYHEQVTRASTATMPCAAFVWVKMVTRK
jgi:hypothetical protein